MAENLDYKQVDALHRKYLAAEAESERLGALVEQKKREIANKMRTVENWNPSTEQYKKALRESNVAKKELAGLKDQYASASDAAKTAGESARASQQAFLDSQRAYGVSSDLTTELSNAKKSYEAIAQKAKDQSWTKTGTSNALKNAQARIDAAQAALTHKPVPAPASDAATLLPNQPTAADTGIDWYHGKKVDAVKGQILWKNSKTGTWSVNTISNVSAKIGKDVAMTNYVRNLLIAQGYKAKDLSGADAVSKVRNAWLDLANKSAGAGVSPFEYQQFNKTFGNWATPGAAGDGSGGPKTYTQTDVSKHVYNAQEIRSDANAAVQKMLGRDITAAELKSITDKLNAYTAKKSPTTVTVQKTSGSGTANVSSSTTSTSSGSTDASQFISNQAKGLSGVSEYQAATTYYDALLGALSGKFGGGI